MTTKRLEGQRGNLLSNLPEAAAFGEVFETLCATPAARIERIVSRGQTTPPDQWLSQPEAEWVLLLAGQATLTFEGQTEPCRLFRGDYLYIPGGCRHRVEWTDPDQACVWLAVHLSVSQE